jgi:DNA polymerase-1
MSKTERPILIVDGLNCFLRHYLVNESVSSKSEPVGGVVGFIKFIDYITNIHMPQKLFVVWETGGGSARRKAFYKDYKKDRGKIKEFKKIHNGTASMRDQLAVDDQVKVAQLSMLHKILKTTPICQIFVAGTEADDIVAYLATQQFRNTDAQKVIVSGDHDYYQLLDDKTITIYDPSKRSYVTGDDVFNTYGIAPRNFCLARALSGDPSDNLDGIPGVGLKSTIMS